MTLSASATRDINHRKKLRMNAFISLFSMALIYIAPLLSQLNHASMNHDAINYGTVNNGLMDHSSMTHAAMPHAAMTHVTINNNGMEDNTSEKGKAFSVAPPSHHLNHSATPTDLTNDNQAIATHHFGLEAACGYCTLLFHLNWLNVDTFSLPAVPNYPYDAVNTPLLAFELPTVYATVQPRAPPRLPATPTKQEKNTIAST